MTDQQSTLGSKLTAAVEKELAVVGVKARPMSIMERVDLIQKKTNDSLEMLNRELETLRREVKAATVDLARLLNGDR